MAIRLHYATKYDVQYSQNEAFGYGQYQIDDVLYKHDCTIYRDEDSAYCSTFSVEKDDIRRLVEELKATDKKEECGLDVKDLISYFEAALNEAEPNGSEVHFCWY